YVAGTTNRHRGLVTFSPRQSGGEDFIAAEALRDDGDGQKREGERGAVRARARPPRSARSGTLSARGAAAFAAFSLPGALREEDVEAGRVGFYDAYDEAPRGRSGRILAALTHAFREDAHELKSTVYVGYRRLELLENFTGFLIDPVNGDRRNQSQ